MKRKNPIRDERRNTAGWNISARQIVFWSILALTFLAPVCKGLYWAYDRLLFTVAFFALGIAWLLLDSRKEDGRWSGGYLAALGMVLVYIVGLFTPASMNGAINGLLMWAGLAVLYWLCSSLDLLVQEREQLLWTVLASGLVLSLIGLASYVGVYQSGFHMYWGRIAAGFEYPNATASLLMVCMFLCFTLGFVETSERKRMFLTGAGIVVLPAFLLTLSRGAWLTAAIVGLIMLGWYRRDILKMMSYLVSVAVPGILATGVLVTKPGAMAFLAVLALAGLGAFVEHKFCRLRYRPIGYGTLSLGALALLAGAGVIFWGASLSRVLPTPVMEAFGRMTYSEFFSDARFIFIGDGLKAFREAPILGYGGGAWKAVYHSFQSYHYGSGRAHSDPLDIVLEGGLIGLLFYTAVIGWGLYAAWKRREDKAMSSILLISTAILIHSFGEALLGFPAMYVVLFASLGSVVVPSRVSNFNQHVLRGICYGLVGVLSIMVILSGSLFLAEAEMQQLNQAVAQGRNVDVLRSLSRVMKLNPWAIEPRLFLNEVLWNERTQRHALRTNLERSLKLEPYDPRVTNITGHFFQMTQDFEKAALYYRASIRLQPLNIQNYEALAFSAASSALELRVLGSKEADKFIEMVYEAYKGFEHVAETTPQDLLKRGAVPFEFSPMLAFALGKAQALEGDLAAAVENFRAAQYSSEDYVAFRAGLWLARIYQISGRLTEAKELVEHHSSSPEYNEYWRKVLKALP